MPPVRWRLHVRNPTMATPSVYSLVVPPSVEGMDETKGKALIAQLIADATEDIYTYLHRWQSGDVVMWDNRASMHQGRPWPDTQARLMVRTTISAREVDGLDQLQPDAKRMC